MNQNDQIGGVANRKPIVTRVNLAKVRWLLSGITLGLLAGAWVGGGTARYGEADGIVGGFRGAFRTMVSGYRYTAATFRECVMQERNTVRNLGLTRQVETRLWQDKRLVAEGIVVEVEEQGTAVLKGVVPDQDHKEKAVALARDTRGVEKVVDELAVAPPSRTIDTAPSAAVPTGVASGTKVEH